MIEIKFKFESIESASDFLALIRKKPEVIVNEPAPVSAAPDVAPEPIEAPSVEGADIIDEPAAPAPEEIELTKDKVKEFAQKVATAKGPEVLHAALGACGVKKFSELHESQYHEFITTLKAAA